MWLFSDTDVQSLGIRVCCFKTVISTLCILIQDCLQKSKYDFLKMLTNMLDKETFPYQLPRKPKFLNEKKKNPITKTFIKYALTVFIYSSLANYYL